MFARVTITRMSSEETCINITIRNTVNNGDIDIILRVCDMTFDLTDIHDVSSRSKIFLPPSISTTFAHIILQCPCFHGWAFSPPGLCYCNRLFASVSAFLAHSGLSFVSSTRPIPDFNIYFNYTWFHTWVNVLSINAIERRTVNNLKFCSLSGTQTNEIWTSTISPMRKI